MDSQTKKYYSANAVRLRSAYRQVNPDFSLRILPVFQEARTVLDIGCGTGRDVAQLLRAGKDAYGVDAVEEMLDQAREELASQEVDGTGRLFAAELPELAMFRDGEFDGILCSAVLMHLPEEKLFDAVYELRRLLKPGGKLLVSIPAFRDDIDPASRRDSDGRLFIDLAPARLQLLLERIGMMMRSSEESVDALGRDSVTWWTGVFLRSDDEGDRPLHRVESILNRDKKDATYKMALVRALAEVAQTQTHLAMFLPEGKVKIPLAVIAEKWILYYWPIFESDNFIPQRTSECQGKGGGVAIRKPLDALIGHFSKAGGLTAFYCDWKSGKLQGEAFRLFRSASSKFQTTIRTMPAKYAGGGNYDVFQYDLLDKTLVMDVALWREFCLMGSWICDATVLRWAEQTEVFAKGAVKASAVIDRLLLAPDMGRNVSDAQKHFRSLPERPCVWSQRPLGADKFAVDHAMPFSYWRNNDLWNLFPSAPEINSRKSDKLPTRRQLQKSREIIVEYWRGLDHALGDRFEREARTLLGRESFTRHTWEPLLFSRFVEAFEVTAAQRGAERWEMPELEASGAPSEFRRPKASPVCYAEAEEGFFVSAEKPLSAVGSAMPQEPDERKIIPFHEVGVRAFASHLPLLGSLAAGIPFHGIETSSLEYLAELDWIEVPSMLARKNRFVIRVAGDSMEPTFEIGDLLVFEYHRNPRRNHEIVIANMPEFGSDSAGTEAIKRISQDAEHWFFLSDNPSHKTFKIRKCDIAHPILGTFVEKLEGTS